MEIFINLYNTILYQPLFNMLVVLYEFIPGRDFGVAVIALTLITRIVFYPLSATGIKAQRKMAELQPKIKEVQEKFKDNKEQQAKATMELYKQEKVNPFGGIAPLLVQIPIFIVMYQLFRSGFNGEQLSLLYSFVPDPGIINPFFFGILDLGANSFAVAVVAGIFQFIQAKYAVPKRQGENKKDMASQLQTSMLYFFPVITIFIVSRFPAALGLYWITTSAFSIWQQWYTLKKK